MALIKPTATGNTFLQKTNTDADKNILRGIVNYDSQLGAAGPTFTLPFQFVPNTNSLQIFIEGVKAIVSQTPADATEYSEDSLNTITFGAAIAPTDVVEFYAPQYVSPVFNYRKVVITNDYNVLETDLYGNVVISNLNAIADVALTLPPVTLYSRLTILNESDSFYLRCNANVNEKFKHYNKESATNGHIGVFRIGHCCTIIGTIDIAGNYWRVTDINGKVYYDY
jgi:hypothetical protein